MGKDHAELVERLREKGRVLFGPKDMRWEAADAIEALVRERDALAERLRNSLPIAGGAGPHNSVSATTPAPV